jgi:Heterokaryon incompatibility protein (HET)
MRRIWPEWHHQEPIALLVRTTNDKPYIPSHYRYKPFDPQKTQVRLLKIESINPGGLIRCQIKIVSLDNAPPFQALSYPWGNGSGYRNISRECSLYRVTENLAAALRQLSQPGSGVPLIWINAICLYLDRYRTKYCGNLGHRPIFLRKITS